MLIKLAVIVGGGALVFFGIQEIRLAQGTTQEPVAITLAELEGGKKIDNAHLAIGEHVALYWDAVYEYEQSKYATGEPGPSAKVNYVYYPVVSTENPFVAQMSAFLAKYENATEEPPQSEVPRVANLAVLVKTKGFATIGDIPQSAAREDALTGMVVNKIESISKRDLELIQQGFPDFDPASVLLLEKDRKPKTLMMSIGMIAGGVVVALIGLGWLLAGAKQQ